MRVPLRERNKQRVIQRIQEAAFELFRTVGYEHTTMDAIAEKAETSRGTVFKYFPTKGSLWLPFMKQLYVKQVQPQVKAYLKTNPSTLHALRFLFTQIYENVFQFPEASHAFQALRQDVFKTYPRNADINKDTGFLDMIQVILQHGQQQGDVRLDIPLEKLIQYVMMLYISQVTELLEKNVSPEYLLEIETLLAFLHTGL
ncbi:MAG: TetR/AcrR family transcriptional regulator [Ktedonobacteraceae bacterium]|nr:TetR/AcrR family transcriptional regulator [Ktedonobacteraceae bacterium]